MTSYTDVFDELVAVEIDLWNRLEALQTADCGVSVAQHQALRAIAAGRGAARVADIGIRLQITVGAASKLVDRLERDGLAARAAHPTDRRSMIVALTASGEVALERASRSAAHILRQLLSPALSESDAAAFTERLAELRATTTAGVPA